MKVSKHCTTSVNFLVRKELTAIYCFASPVHAGLLQCYITFGSSVTQASIPFCHSQYTVESNAEIWFSATHLSSSGNLEALWSMWSLLKEEKTYIRNGRYGDPWICNSSFLLVCTDTYTGVSTKATLTHDITITDTFFLSISSHQQHQAQTHELCFPHNDAVFNCVSVILSSTLSHVFLSVYLWLCMLTPPSGLLAWLWKKGEVTNALMEQRRSQKCTLLTKFWNLEVTTAFSWQSFGTKEKWQM